MTVTPLGAHLATYLQLGSADAERLASASRADGATFQATVRSFAAVRYQTGLDGSPAAQLATIALRNHEQGYSVGAAYEGLATLPSLTVDQRIALVRAQVTGHRTSGDVAAVDGTVRTLVTTAADRVLLDDAALAHGVNAEDVREQFDAARSYHGLGRHATAVYVAAQIAQR